MRLDGVKEVCIKLYIYIKFEDVHKNNFIYKYYLTKYFNSFINLIIL